VIISRTPLRISLGGGGTDVPTYYRKAGSGFLIAAAISKYVYIAVNHTFDESIFLKYSDLERVDHPEGVRHPLLREILLATGIRSGVEISSMADIPAGTGLGSSGAFAVGALNALRAYSHEITSNYELARQACDIEIERLGEPIGKQDQFIAAMGGITGFEFHADEHVEVVALDLAPRTRQSLEENLLLFYTGVRRSASDALAIEHSATTEAELEDNLDRVKQIGLDTREVLEAGDLHAFGEMLTRQWQLKYERGPGGLHDQVDGWIRADVDAGATGGKLVGAGGGGFVLFYAEPKAELREVMAGLGLVEVRFSIDYQGSSVITST